jgi:hypothetical protein
VIIEGIEGALTLCKQHEDMVAAAQGVHGRVLPVRCASCHSIIGHRWQSNRRKGRRPNAISKHPNQAQLERFLPVGTRIQLELEQMNKRRKITK